MAKEIVTSRGNLATDISLDYDQWLIRKAEREFIEASERYPDGPPPPPPIEEMEVVEYDLSFECYTFDPRRGVWIHCVPATFLPLQSKKTVAS
jgi:hypothetical protein